MGFPQRCDTTPVPTIMNHLQTTKEKLLGFICFTLQKDELDDDFATMFKRVINRQGLVSVL